MNLNAITLAITRPGSFSAMRDVLFNNIELEDGFNILLEDSGFILLEG